MEQIVGNQAKILRYILDKGETSKAQIAKDLNLSMPTVLQAIKVLSEQGVIQETGVYESTGGRKAKAIAVCPDTKYAVGLDITKHHIGLVLINMNGQVVNSLRKRKVFSHSIEYCNEISLEIQEFLKNCKIDMSKILGVGISFPGIVDNEHKVLKKSHALQLENASLRNLEGAIAFPVYFENDANAALMAEKAIVNDNVLYLSLSDTVGGAVCIDGKLFRGDSQRAGEFGHMSLYFDGRRCYCGKRGCVDAYCSALVLRTNEDMTLEQFMEQVKKQDAECCRIWDEYLQNLALVITNLRMAMDVDIILGGYVGHYLKDYMVQLGSKILERNIFDTDISYLRNCTLQKEVSAVGAARYFIDRYVYEYSS